MFTIMLYVPSEYDHVPSFFGYSIFSIFFSIWSLCIYFRLGDALWVNGITVISSPYSTVIYSYDRTQLWPKIPVISQWNHPLYKSNHIYNQLSSGFYPWKITVFIGKSTITWQFSSSQTLANCKRLPVLFHHHLRLPGSALVDARRQKQDVFR